MADYEKYLPLFICFPVRLCLWIFIGAVIGKKVFTVKS